MDYTSGSNLVLGELASRGGEHVIDPAQSHNRDGKFPRLKIKCYLSDIFPRHVYVIANGNLPIIKRIDRL
jgi:hypothetical protein